MKIIIKVIIERLLTRYEILLNIMNVWSFANIFLRIMSL